MQGWNISEGGHTVQILPPQNIAGGVTTIPFSMKNAEHVSVLFQFGAVGAVAPTSISLQLLQTAASSPATAGQSVGFRYYVQSVPGLKNDLLSPPVYSGTSGLTVISPAPNFLVQVEFDAAEITGGQNSLNLSDSDGVDYPYLAFTIANAASNTIQCAAVAVLSGVRQQYQGGVSVTS